MARFAKKRSLDLESVVRLDDVVTCLPVIIQEVLQGFDDERAYCLAKEALTSFPVLESPISEEVFFAFIDLYRLARKRGVTIRSSIDCLIAACAIRNNVQVLHRGRDSVALARVCKLEQSQG